MLWMVSFKSIIASTISFTDYTDFGIAFLPKAPIHRGSSRRRNKLLDIPNHFFEKKSPSPLLHAFILTKFLGLELNKRIQLTITLNYSILFLHYICSSQNYEWLGLKMHTMCSVHPRSVARLKEKKWKQKHCVLKYSCLRVKT